MLLIDDEQKFGIMWEIMFSSECNKFIYGTVKIIINGEVFPKKTAFNETINVVFHNMKQSFITPYYSAGNDGHDLGSIFIENEALSYGKVKNIFSISLGDLETSYEGWEKYGSLRLELGYDGNTERLFYSEDNGDTFKETKLKKGSVQSVIMKLPNFE